MGLDRNVVLGILGLVVIVSYATREMFELGWFSLFVGLVAAMALFFVLDLVERRES